MNEHLRQIYHHFKPPNTFQKYWYIIENVLDLSFPWAGQEDTFRRRAERLEKSLNVLDAPGITMRRLLDVPQFNELAELTPRIHRDSTGSTASHDAFASDVTRIRNGRAPRAPFTRLLLVLYDVRCNEQHGQKILPDEWEAVRDRNKHVFDLVTPLAAVVAETLAAIYAVPGVFSYGTLASHFSDDRHSLPIRIQEGFRTRGCLYDLGRFPGMRDDLNGWTHGSILAADEANRLRFLGLCDEIEGHAFIRRLAITRDEHDAESVAWAYFFDGDTASKPTIPGGRWPLPNAG
jgi:gamma-glutamylcyclotransferase (GGCT)/AIG2-like uncharacterized protein YtfP